ncbi:MAG: GPP34 family phosphoprotein [Candidatus Cloacimonetes bacterium]|nr:GPP34 family phosphoprotein [Candidatus Cloacimonadota bacterium]
MQNCKLSIAEEFLLLSLDDEKGVVCNQPFMGLEFGLAGAVLMELALMGRLRVDEKKLEVLADSATGNQIFDDALAMISSQQAVEDAKYWVWKLGIHIQEIKEYFISHLIELGILEKKEQNILWIYRRKCYPMLDDKVEREDKERIRKIVLDGVEPEPRDIILISLMHSCNLTSEIFSREEQDNYCQRIESIAQMNLIGKAVYEAIYEIIQKMSVQQVYY